MAQHFDLEEQEQLDQIKHFWKTHGTWITWLAVVVLAAVAAWNGYQLWQNRQASQASALYDAIESAANAGDAARLKQAFGDIREKYPRTAYAQQAGLLAGRVLDEKGEADEARAALQWVADKAADEGLQALARLRLAGLLVEKKAYDEALAQVSGSFPPEFAALVADRKGDILALQGKKPEAAAAYTQAYQKFDERSEYRGLVEVKLNALGVDPRATAAAPATEDRK
ncbi:YfgM family protein [Xylophilus sp.]|uniref:YfgM family protein n=1 Tax=Xylophilus sp. TaxID=2653893 RepID=UPI0013B72434|nr:tetratricopeptide repeat protein [Xylophilus sp.]KAF1046529.1 MAG: hypothetical protein GAK38_02436 [Xylophilus sp.]